jgi:hypothetical protein
MTARTRKHRKVRSKTSKRTLKSWNDDSTSVWGKNRELEAFWRGLANGKYVVVIYKNGKNKYVNLPSSPHTRKSTEMYNDFDANRDIVAVLSSNSSQDAYEQYLYPKAKGKSVKYVIQNYKKFFKTMAPPSKYDIENGATLMKKVMVPS